MQITSGYHPGDAPGGFESLRLNKNEVGLSQIGHVQSSLKFVPPPKGPATSTSKSTPHSAEARPKLESSEDDPLAIPSAIPLKVQSLDVRRPLIFSPPFPVFISTVPGTTHHFFKSVSIGGTFRDFNNNMAALYRGGNTRKVLVIERMQIGLGSNPGSVHGVVLNLSSKSTSLIFRDSSGGSDRFYARVGGKQPQEISRERYLLETFATLRGSRPRSKTARLAGPWGESEGLWKDKFAEFCEACRQGNDDPGLVAIQQVPQLKELNTRCKALQSARREELLTTLDAERTALEATLVRNTADKSALLHAAVRLDLKSLALRVLDESLGETLDFDQRDLSSDTVLSRAARRDWTEVVLELLRRGVNVDVADAHGITPLMQAAYNDNEVLVDALINHSSNGVDAQDNEGITALSHAFGKGTGRAFDLLLKAGADPLKCDKKGRTLATRGVTSEDPSAFKTLIKEVDPALLNSGAVSPLNMAIRLRLPAQVKGLIEDFGADVNHEDGNGNLPLVAALNHGSKRQLDQLLKAKGIDVNAGTKTTPLLTAINLGNYRTVVRLLDAGAKPDLERGGVHPLTAAVRRRDRELVELLIERGARTPADILQGLIAVEDEQAVGFLLDQRLVDLTAMDAVERRAVIDFADVQSPAILALLRKRGL